MKYDDIIKHPPNASQVNISEYVRQVSHISNFWENAKKDNSLDQYRTQDEN